uniref:Guanylate kinase-like domain-containing protein n=1 Tax=Elaeophora elaphi TaxID=1147741 RepID=A0A0R3S6D7_9BILA
MSSRKVLISKQASQDNEDIDLVALEKSLNSINVIRKTSHTSISDGSDKKCNLLETISRTVQISCQPPLIPFTIQGGSEEGCLILVELVLHPDLLNALATDDIILSINERKVSGMLSRDVRRLLESLFAVNESFYMEIVNKDSIPSSITEILAGEDYPELQIVIRNNVYQKTVPYTTRQPRNGEIDGVHYKFVDVPTFRQLRDSNQLLEHGHYQGFTNFPKFYFHIFSHPFLFSHTRT